MKKNNKGFSLVELIVVIAIMAILAAIAIPTFAHFITKANVANDEELMNNINYIFKAACLENGVDVSEVKSAAISYSENADMSIANSVVMKDGDTELADKIESSFTLHFADMAKEKFKSKEYNAVTTIYFKDGKFDIKNVGGKFSNIFNSIEGIDELAADVKNSTFGTIGAEGLLDRLDQVTGLAESLLGTQTGESLKVALSADFADIAASMGLTVDELTELIDSQEDPDAYYHNLLSNYAVLQVAKTTSGKESADLLADLRGGMSTDDIKNMIGSDDDESSKNGVSKAAMMYAMYTAYANQLQPGAEKDQAMANLTSMDAFVIAINDETKPNTGFMNYLSGAQAETDMDGFVASMNIISNSTKGNTEATRDLLENGYDNSDLADSLQGVIGKN